jgi:hypothetical protein
LIHAFEKKKRLIPVLKDVTFSEFEHLRPDWKLAVGPSVAERLAGSDIDRSVRRLVLSLERMGVKATGSQRKPKTVLTRLRLGPDAVVRELLPLVSSGHLKCSYRLALESNVGPWSATTLVRMPSGLFVILQEVPEDALVEVQVVHDDRTWTSRFIAVAVVEAQLDEAS